MYTFLLSQLISLDLCHNTSFNLRFYSLSQFQSIKKINKKQNLIDSKNEVEKMYTINFVYVYLCFYCLFMFIVLM